jgi:uncharacterized lipoprotein YddW (UPF0748 family)
LFTRSLAFELPLQRDENAEIRAVWVDGYHRGIRSVQETDYLVSAAKRTGFNTLIVQVRCNADSYYTRSFEPPVENQGYNPRFDALAYVVDLAHREGLEVHAWVNAMPLWRSPFLPGDPEHLFYRHGPAVRGDENWLTCSREGDAGYPAGYYLDPGHPKAAEYVAAVCSNILRHYDVDGIHLDYIRYPETEKQLPRGASVGYNPVSLERFRQATGREGIPEPADPAWNAWRRQQVTQLVRRIYLEAKEIKPRVKVSAALVSWGSPPQKPEDFVVTAPGQRVFQDWNDWLREGILDLAIPMNYIREGDPITGDWFDGWIRWQKTNKHGRQLAIGIGAYLNTPGSTMRQIARARRAEKGHKADGISVFSFAELGYLSGGTGNSHHYDAEGIEASSDGGSEMTPLTDEVFPGFALFERTAPIPPMSWLDDPEQGMAAGVLRDDSGRPRDSVGLSLKRTGLLSPFRPTHDSKTDGNGFFGFLRIPPGEYQLRIAGEAGARIVEIEAGKVTRISLNP